MSMKEDLTKEEIPENNDDYDQVVDQVFDEKYGRNMFVVRKVKKEKQDKDIDDGTNTIQQTLYFQKRTQDLGLDKNIGQRLNIEKDAHKSQHGGYYCQLCDTHVWDSNAWLDHINGKKHNRLLGMNNKVEKVSIEDIKAKLQSVKKEKIEKNKAYDLLISDIADDDQSKRKQKNQNDRKKLKTEEDQKKSDENEESKNQQTKEGDKEKNDENNGDEEEEEEEDPNAAMMAMLGLPTSFQHSKTKK